MAEVDETENARPQVGVLDSSADVHLRKLRYFLAVARHLSFAQAARELFVAQPALSRAVKALEADYGVRLLDRDSQRVSLTAAGRVLVEEATTLLERASLARQRVRAAAQGRAHLSVGFQPGVVISEIVSAFAERHPHVGLSTRRLECHPDPTQAFKATIDVALIRAAERPASPAIFHLYEDPTLVAMPATHRLAAIRTLSLDDLEAETMLCHASSEEERSNVAVRNLEEGLEAVLLRRGLAWVPASAAAYYRRSGIVYRPVAGAPRFDIVLAVDPARLHRDEVNWFLQCAREYYRDRHYEPSDDSIAA